MSSGNKLTVAILQLPVTEDAQTNVEAAVQEISNVKKYNPKVKLVILPEVFNAPYGVEHFAKYAEKVPEGPTCQRLRALARTLGIYIIAGSIIERADNDKLYNTCTVWSPSGELIGKHRKIHLFTVDIDVEVQGGVRFDESLALSPGNKITIVEVDGHKIGIGICHDMRFEELARIYRNKGCEMLVYPAAFCICQGPMFFTLLNRGRASDNQVFVLSCSPSRNNMSGYVDYGHSMIVNPWGEVLREAGMGREIIVEEIDFDVLASVRRQVPLFEQRRTDIYKTELLN